MAVDMGIAGIFFAESGGIHPLVWILAIMIAAFSIVIVWIIMYFLLPMKNSPARHIVKAKRERKPAFFLDDGKFFRCVVGDHQVGEEKAQVFRHGQDIVKGGEGMKYCEGVLMGIGEDFRSLTVNVGIIDLMELIETKGWDADEVKSKLEKLADKLKEDLGLKDELKDVNEKYAKERAEVNAEYDNRRNTLIEQHEVPEAPEPPEKDEEDGAA